MKIRHALLVTFAERYVNVALNFVVTAVVARLLTPAEFGLVAICTSILGVTETIRDFGISNYLVQKKDLSQDAARTGFTVVVLTSVILSVLLLASADAIAAFYNEPRLAPYIRVMGLTALTGIVNGPLMALMRRDMAFSALALVNLSATLVIAATTVALAVLGFGYMSFAWAGLAGSVTYSVMSLVFRPDFWIFRPALKDWRSALAFGGYSSLSDMLARAQDFLSYLIMGRLLPVDAVGHFNRAGYVSQVPIKLLMVGVMPVALPGFAAEARSGSDLRRSYLRALVYMTAVMWPALVLMIFLAHPAIAILLGDQWFAAVPLLQILAFSQLPAAPTPLNFPVLSAVGAIRQCAILGAVSLVISVAALLAAAPFGIMAVAWSFAVASPLQSFLAVWLIRLYIPFTWGELAAALRPSVLVTLWAGAVPVLVFVLLGFRFDMSISLGVATGVLSVLSWLAGVWVSGHPISRDLASFLAPLATRLRLSPAQPGRPDA